MSTSRGKLACDYRQRQRMHVVTVCRRLFANNAVRLIAPSALIVRGELRCPKTVRCRATRTMFDVLLCGC
jgi:hypothetical protein